MITIDILGVFSKIEVLQNEFMHAVDLFSNSKQLASHIRIVITTTNPNISTGLIQKNIKKIIESQGGYVLFIGICHVNGKKYDDQNYYLKKGINILSMINEKTKQLGWTTFKDVLNQLGYKVETTQDMKVIKIN